MIMRVESTLTYQRMFIVIFGMQRNAGFRDLVEWERFWWLVLPVNAAGILVSHPKQHNSMSLFRVNLAIRRTPQASNRNRRVFRMHSL